MEFILELAFRVVKAERGFLMLTAGDGNGSAEGLEVKAVRSSSDEDLKAEGITFSRSIAEKVIAEKVSILTSNAMTDPRFRSQDSIVAVGIRSAMCVPLWNNKIVTGLIYVDSRIHENVFNQDDLSLLTSLANVAAIKLENAKLVEAMIEKKRIEHELEQARRIQKDALPGMATRTPRLGYRTARILPATPLVAITTISSPDPEAIWPLLWETSRARVFPPP